MEEYLANILSAYPTFAPALFVIVRAVAVIIPPVPGILTDLVGIVAFGWMGGLILGELGIIIGSVTAFWLARTLRERLVRRLVPLQAVEEWEGRYSEHQKFWALVAIRLVAIPFFDYISYAAGLTKIRLGVFLLSTFLGTFPLMFVVYYFGGLTFNKGLYFGVLFAIGIIAVWLMYKNADVVRYCSKLWGNRKNYSRV